MCDYGRFTRITGAGGQTWLDAAKQVSQEVGVEVAGVQVSLRLEVNDVYQHWASRREIVDGGCVLARQDRIVAWRSMESIEDRTAKLREVMMQILHRSV